MNPNKGRFSNKPCFCADVMFHSGALKVASIHIFFNKYCRNKSKRNIKDSQYGKLIKKTVCENSNLNQKPKYF